MSDLYQAVILDHYRHPRCHGSIDTPTASADGINASCGDKLHMDILVEGDTIKTIRFQGVGCAISQASASLLTETIEGKPLKDAMALTPADILQLLNVSLSPSRMKCGLLSLETLKKTLSKV